MEKDKAQLVRDYALLRQALPNFNPPTPMPPIDPVSAVVLKELLRTWDLVEKATGYQWRATSYIRNSPSHSRAVSLDIAPSISDASWRHYSVSRSSDPVLYKREPLIRKLQSIARLYRPALPAVVGLYIEPDHIHIQVFKLDQGDSPRFTVVKWGLVKPCYHDSASRASLPLINAKGLPLR